MKCEEGVSGSTLVCGAVVKGPQAGANVRSQPNGRRSLAQVVREYKVAPRAASDSLSQAIASPKRRLFGHGLNLVVGPSAFQDRRECLSGILVVDQASGDMRSFAILQQQSRMLTIQ